MSEFKNLLTGVASSAIWPSYLALLAYTARQAPWPRGIALLTSALLFLLALGGFALNLIRWVLRPAGWVETVLRVPPPVTRQLNRAALSVVIAGMLLLLPEWLLSQGYVLHSGRPIATPALCRFLELGFGLTVWGVVYWLVHGRSPLVEWLLQFPDRLGWLNRRRRAIAWSSLAAIAGVLALDARGYSYTAHRVSIGAVQVHCVIAFCWALHRLLLKLIDGHAWRWMRPAVASTPRTDDATDDSGQPTDLAGRLRRLAGYLVPLLGLFLTAWAWNLDLALFRSIGETVLFPIDHDTNLTLGDLAQCVLSVTLTAIAWRHLSTFFAVAVFPRMPDDPGIRFAVLTLCRYLILGIGVLASLTAIHLGPTKIGVVLAALGVGLGFGLQEIVSNFVCGIILLLERPIRVGDVVTVAGMSGKVDRINIRATTITNGENQSMIIPNRAFITGDLINWTLKDKVIRATVRVKVTHGNDPERVTDLLLSIAREDPDVLSNPVPCSLMEDFSDSDLLFVLHVHVPDPSLSGRVRHRLMTQIQKRFREGGIAMALPTQELLLKPMPDPPSVAPGTARNDPPSAVRLAPHFPVSPRPTATVEESHRGVDE